MINLLPNHAKKSLAKEFKLRLGVVVLCVVIGLEILTAVLFLPAYLTISASTKTLSEQLGATRAATPKEGEDVQKQILGIKKEIELLKPAVGASSTPPSVLLGELLKDKPRGIEISAFAYARAKTSIGVQLSGLALTRDELLAFQKSLRANPLVADIKYGSSFITKKTNIDFVITVTLK